MILFEPVRLDGRGRTRASTMTKHLVLSIIALVLLSAAYATWRGEAGVRDLPLPPVTGSEALASGQRPLPRPEWMDVEEAAVIKAVIEQEFLEFDVPATRTFDQQEGRFRKARVATIAIARSTALPGDVVGPHAGDWLQTQIPALSQRTWWNFAEQNSRPSPFTATLSLPVPYVLSDPPGLKTEDWIAFQRDHPGAHGYLRFSRAGFDGDGRQALIYVAHVSGNLGAPFQFFFLEQRDGTWRIVQSALAGMS